MVFISTLAILFRTNSLLDNRDTSGMQDITRCQESTRSCLCVLVVSSWPLSVICEFNFGTVLIVWYFFVFHFIHFLTVANLHKCTKKSIYNLRVGLSNFMQHIK